MTTPTERSGRALALFDELVERDARARETLLASIRRTEPELALEVERLLAADAQSGVIDDGIAALAKSAVAGQVASDEAGTASNAGRRIGPFVLDRMLGYGGMGEVWLARRAQGDFQQNVALKLLKRGMDSEDLLRRFVQERRILAELSHPDIARFIDGGVSEDGAQWYAMEYVDGVPITTFAREQALDVRARVALVASVAEAVGYAQTRLVVHRDLKPSNILVDAKQRAHLLDFGIAKLLQVEDDVRATATGVRAMSPAYAAPEQILDEPISTATDVYALGVVLYELLTGVLPHARSTTSIQNLAEHVRHEEPERPSAKLRATAAQSSAALGVAAGSVQRFARTVAGELDTIVLTTLRREPARRYASAAALADDLRRWLDGRPVAAQPDTAAYRTRKFVARHRLAVGSASAVLLALVVGVGVALWQANLAREQARRAEQQAAVATAVTDFLTQDVIRAANPFRNPLDLSVSEALRRAVPGIDARFRGQPRLAGVVRNQLAESLYLAGDMATAETVTAVAQQGLEASFGDLDPDALTARLRRARIMVVADRWDEAQALYDAVRPRLVGARLNPFRLQVDAGLAGLMIERRQEAQGLALLEALAPELEANFDALSQINIDAAVYRMSAYTQTERWEDALAMCRRYEAMIVARFGKQSPMRLEWMRRQAQLLRLEGRFDEAQPLAEATLALATEILGEEHFATDEIRQQLVPVYFGKGDFARASVLAERVAKFREQHFGARSEKTWLSWVWQARTYQHLERNSEARAIFDRAVAASRDTLGADDPGALSFRQTLGMFLHQTGQLAEAEALRRQVLERSQAALPAGHINIARYAWDLGETLASADRHEQVLELLAHWLPQWEQQFGADDSRVKDAKGWLARSKAAQQ